MLKSIFISHHFDDKAMEFAEAVSRLVSSHNLKPVTGKRLMGEALSDGVKSKMDSCQATIVLLTNREEGKTNQWVKDERAYAEGKGHHIITLLDKGLYDDGMFTGRERLRINWDNLHLNILDLSETINMWRQSKGTIIKLLLQPDKVSRIISNSVEEHTINYRIWRETDIGSPPGWKSISARPEQGGATIYIPDVKENDLIEVKVNVKGIKWFSPAANPNIVLKLKAQDNGN